MKKSASGSDNRSLARPGVRSVNAPREMKYGEADNIATRSGSSVRETRISDDNIYGRGNGYKSTSSSKTPSRKPVKRKNGRKAGGIIALVLALLIVAGGAGAYYLYTTGYFDPKYEVTAADGTVLELKETELRTALETDKFIEGIIIDGVNVGGMTKEEALAAVKANQPEAPIDVDIKLDVGDEVIPLDLSDLTLESNLNEVVDTAYAYLRLTGTEDVNTLVTVYNAREALKNNPQVYNTAYTLNSDGVTTIVHNALDGLNSEPVNAEVRGFNTETLEFDISDSEKGYSVDVDGAITDVKTLLDSGTYTAEIPVTAEVMDPEFEKADIEDDFGLISSSSSTTTADSNRNHNINTACEKINGCELAPGEVFSFNGYVGRRTEAAGYRNAPVIANGTTEPGLGGGVCQVSSMIFQSAVKADLTITDRYVHMWPSSYAPAGTDATVDYDSNQDLKFMNSSDWPIYIVANWDASTSRITVSMYGHRLEDGKYIDIEGEVVSRSPSSGTAYIADATKPVGTSETRGSVHDSVTARTYQVWYDRDGNEIDRVQIRSNADSGNWYYAGSSRTVYVGVLNPDGSTAPMDPNTGAVQTTPPSETSEETPAPTAEPGPTETTPTETTPSETTPPETTPSETTAAPTETAPAPIPETEATSAVAETPVSDAA